MLIKAGVKEALYFAGPEAAQTSPELKRLSVFLPRGAAGCGFRWGRAL